MTIYRFHHAQITVPEGAVDEARRFYCQLLGLDEIEKPLALRERGGFWLQVGNQELHIGVESGVDRWQTKAHVAFEVDDLEAVRRRLQAEKIEAGESVPIPGFQRFEIRDPFGNRVEFIQPQSAGSPVPAPDVVTHLFSERVEYYQAYRPHYPPPAVEFLEEAVDLPPEAVIADIGSGTGILSASFLERGYVVYGVEPNGEMRRAAEASLAQYARFRSVDGRAEETRLPQNSVDLITVGQACHWFEQEAAQTEFKRILRPAGFAAFFYNDWKIEGSAFARAYDELRRRYRKRARQQAKPQTSRADAIERFFAPYHFAENQWRHAQTVGFEGFRGRTLSISNMPLPGSPAYGPMIADLRRIFDRFREGDRLQIEYVTHLYWGRIS